MNFGSYTQRPRRAHTSSRQRSQRSQDAYGQRRSMDEQDSDGLQDGHPQQPHGASHGQMQGSWESHGSFRRFAPSEKRRQDLLEASRRDEEAIRRRREQQPYTFSLSGGVLGGACKSQEEVYARLQQKQSYDRLTAGIRQQEKREAAQRARREREEAEIQPHKERQRRKAEKLEQRKLMEAQAAQSEVRSQWSTKPISPTTSCNPGSFGSYHDDDRDWGSRHGQDLSSNPRKARERAEEARRRQREREDAEIEEHKQRQRRIAKRLEEKERVEAEVQRSEVRRQWASTDSHSTYQVNQISSTSSGSLMAPASENPVLGLTEEEAAFHRNIPVSPGGQAEHSPPSRPSSSSLLSSKDNQRPLKTSSFSEEETYQLTMYQMQMVELGLPEISLLELKQLLRNHNNSFHSLLNSFFPD